MAKANPLNFRKIKLGGLDVEVGSKKKVTPVSKQSVGKMTDREKKEQLARSAPKPKKKVKRTYYGD